MLKKLIKTITSIFAGPRPLWTSAKGKSHKRSTSHTRYSAVQGQSRKSVKPKPRSVIAKAPVKRKTAHLVKKKAVNKKAVVPKIHPGQKLLKTKELKPRTSKEKPNPPEFYVGEITHYFSKISVVVVKVVEHPILVGDLVHIRGDAVDIPFKVESLQVESKDVRFAKRGELVGLKVPGPVKPGSKIFKTKR